MVNFLLVSPSRSGSTSLRETLDEQPGFLCHGEILALARVLGVSGKLRRKHSDISFDKNMRNEKPKRFMELLLDRNDFSHCGFKAIYNQVTDHRNEGCMDWFLDRNPKIVFLWRRNLVARFQSACRFRIDLGQMSQEQYQSVTPKEIISDAKRQSEMAAQNLERLQRANTDILKVDFEDLVSDAGTLQNILEFVGHGEIQTNLSKDQRTKKNEKRQKITPKSEAVSAMMEGYLADLSLDEALAWAGT